MSTALARNGNLRAHKMDAGLRGNWPFEIEVMLEAGYKVAVVCSFPDAGRRCLDGVVYIHDLPVLESVFGADPLNAPISSRPAEVLEHSGVRGDVVVWDANDNKQMLAAVRRARAEDRLLVGASGALGALATTVFPNLQPRTVALPRPMLVICGSLNPLSRRQIAAVGVPIQALDQQLDLTSGIAVVATDQPNGDITLSQAETTAAKAAALAREHWDAIGTLIIVGGDTAAAVVGDDPLDVQGTVAPGVPASNYAGLCLITKGGGIGQPDTLKELWARSQ